VFILKVVKVLCFDTLLQVLILNEIEADCRNREVPTRVCHPPCFAKRVRKLLKTKDDDRKKRGKRFQEAASS